MSYTPPAYIAASFTWVGLGAYTAPAHTAADFTWVPVIADVTGEGVGVVPITGAGVGHLAFVGVGAGVVPVTGAGTGLFGVVITGEGVGNVPITGAGAGVLAFVGAGGGVVPITGAGGGVSGASGVGAATVPISGAALAVHHRYEVRGEVKMGGVLVNRRVRVYNRDTGALISQGDTVAGKFRLHAGLAEAQVYVLPIDLADAAVDWRPPTANRVLSVLAEDAP